MNIVPTKCGGVQATEHNALTLLFIRSTILNCVFAL